MSWLLCSCGCSLASILPTNVAIALRSKSVRNYLVDDPSSLSFPSEGEIFFVETETKRMRVGILSCLVTLHVLNAIFFVNLVFGSLKRLGKHHLCTTNWRTFDCVISFQHTKCLRSSHRTAQAVRLRVVRARDQSHTDRVQRQRARRRSHADAACNAVQRAKCRPRPAHVDLVRFDSRRGRRFELTYSSFLLFFVSR